jgi:hypothetical protein
VAELDYAYLAEFAQVIDGKLTAVNASFIHVNTPVPAMFQFAVAGRVRAPVDAGEVRLAIKLVSPDGNTTIAWQVGLQTAGHPVYNGKVGILFALRAAVPLGVHGLYRVTIDVDDEEARRLAFEAVEP